MTVTRYTELLSEQDWARLKEELALPPRQAEVVKCILRGMGDKQIAVATGISVNTVRTHMTRLFSKFGARDRVELILHMFGYLKQYHPQDKPAPASAIVAPEAVYPAARKHHKQRANSRCR